jgi:hypothetical protein
LPIFRSTRLCVTVCGIMHPRCCRPVAGNFVGALHFFTRLVRSIACSAQDTNCQQSRVDAHFCSCSFRLAACQSFSWIIVKHVSRRREQRYDYTYLSFRPDIKQHEEKNIVSRAKEISGKSYISLAILI